MSESSISGSASFSLNLAQLEHVVRAAGAQLSRVQLVLILGRLGVELEADDASRPPSTPSPDVTVHRSPVSAGNAPAHGSPTTSPPVPSSTVARVSHSLTVDRPAQQAVVHPGPTTQGGDIEGLTQFFNSSCSIQPCSPGASSSQTPKGRKGKKPRHHAVTQGRTVGIIYGWNIAHPEVNKFSGCCHEGFDTRDEALDKFWEAWAKKKVFSETGNIVGIPGLVRMPGW